MTSRHILAAGSGARAGGSCSGDISSGDKNTFEMDMYPFKLSNLCCGDADI